MAFIQYSEKGNSPLQKLLGHHPEVLKSWDLLLETFYKFSSFDPNFKDHEIAELCAFIGFGMGYARFGASLGVDVILGQISIAAFAAKKL